jgi:hypothetical protein
MYVAEEQQPGKTSLQNPVPVFWKSDGTASTGRCSPTSTSSIAAGRRLRMSSWKTTGDLKAASMETNGARLIESTQPLCNVEDHMCLQHTYTLRQASSDPESTESRRIGEAALQNTPHKCSASRVMAKSFTPQYVRVVNIGHARFRGEQPSLSNFRTAHRF